MATNGPADVPAGFSAVNLTGASHKAASGGTFDNTTTSATSTIHVLPNELLTQILGYLDINKPSDNLLDEPRLDLTQSDTADLKAASRVSKQWRRIVFPSLFKHAQFIVSEPKHHRKTLDEQTPPFLAFAVRTSLRSIIASFTLVVQDAKVSGNGGIGLDPFSTFWHSLFDVLDPPELLIIAPVEALAPLTTCRVELADSWQFDCPCHYIQLKRPLTSATTPAETSQGDDGTITSNARPWYSTLFEVRPWNSLLLNEGSFIRAYATYEWWQREPPSILPDLVGVETPNNAALISPTIRDMSYIGIFPISSHFNCLVNHFPRLDRLYTQLVPRSEILQDRTKMSQVEAEDLWMERNGSYANLMRELFNAPPVNNYRYLKVFESGDAADRDAWNMAVEYVKRAGNGWEVAGDGVFTRDPTILPLEPTESDEGEPSLLYGLSDVNLARS
ncbi:hypothetical protein BDZ45DRAFT_689687 [Acephala macrosclerotiorum]|nr:hypothetical protein BDZ45DRAFT_689687 [Acephala macrosclerotiorum]